MAMRKLLLLGVFLFLVLCGMATEYHRTINWKQVVSIENQAIGNLFEGANLIGDDNLPYWVESFKLQSADANVSVSDTLFEPYVGPAIAFSDLIEANIKFFTNLGTSAGQSHLRVSIFPFIKKGDKIFKLMKFSLSINEINQRLKSAKAPYQWKQSSVLSTGKWIKIKVKNKGIYKISYAQLKAWGFASPENVVLYGNGGYILPVLNRDLNMDDLKLYPMFKGQDNANRDCLFFYATGNIKVTYDNVNSTISHQQNPYATETYFYLSDQGNPLVIEKTAELNGPAGRQITSFPNYIFHEKEEKNLIFSGSDWYGEQFNMGGSNSIVMTLDNPDLEKPAVFKVAAAGKSTSSNSMDVQVNGKSLMNLPFGISTDYEYAKKVVKTATQPLTSKTVQFRLTYNASNSVSSGWLDYISINYQSQLSMVGDMFNFRGRGVDGTTQISEFVLSDASPATKVLNVTNLFQVVEMPASFQDGTLKFKSNSSLFNEYIAFNTNGAIPIPELMGEVANQNLHGESVSEMIIVTNPLLLNASNLLAEFHRTTDKMDVKVVPADLIYNEFSSGLPDPAGIRNYLRMCYDQGKQSGTTTLKYVLLMGDGSYDNRNIHGKKLNLLPTYQSDNSLTKTLSFVTDDFYAILDENEGGYSGIIDLGIGRIPADNLRDALGVVDKIVNYNTNEAYGSWRNVVTFIGDDGNIADGFTNIHQTQAESMAVQLNNKYPGFFTDKIYFDAYKKITSAGGEKYPEVTEEIIDRIKRGTLVLNYTGHANERNLADENVLDIGNINSLTNNTRLPIFVTATCEFSRFDADESSAGEHFLMNPDGGGIGLFSTTRLVYSDANFTLNQNFFKYVFEKDQNGNNHRLGDVMRLAKAATNNTNQLNFTLLADPALMLAQPEFKVMTTSINGKDTQIEADTLKTMSIVTVKGFVADSRGIKMDSFNGEIVPTVYDKSMVVQTLGNSLQQPMNYTVQNNIIHRGLASVTNGEFEFSFFVPKDISYKIDKGKIIYYAYNETDDANGYFDNFFIGGASNSAITDSEGPTINFFINSEAFQEGGQVSANAVLIANIIDHTGINTAGTGIGHDITAVIDGDYSNIMVLNDYFQSRMDKHTEGSVVFPLNNLSEGKHTLTIKVWDVLNNSSEKQITFVVKDDFTIESVECYPNPMDVKTNFIFTHNLPDETFDVTLEVFQPSGTRVDIVHEKVNSNGLESLPLEWNPGSRSIIMKAGIYIYRLTVIAQGKTSSASGRLVYVYR